MRKLCVKVGAMCLGLIGAAEIKNVWDAQVYRHTIQYETCMEKQRANIETQCHCFQKWPLAGFNSGVTTSKLMK